MQLAGLKDDDRWRGWEWREVFLNCTRLMNTRVGEGNYTLHLLFAGLLRKCGQAFLFVSGREGA